jgi:uncharacterized phiE125 gp8 family phage protein
MRHDEAQLLMRVGLKLITPPATEPIGLQEAKDQLNRTDSADDQLIEMIISEARDYIEGKASKALLTQTWDQSMDGFPWSVYSPFAGNADWIELRRAPVQSVTSITYIDSTGTPNVWPSSNYVAALVGEPPRIVPAFGKVWPAVALQPLEGVIVRFVAGYTSAALIPGRYREAQMLMIGHWYQNREAVLTGTRLVSIETARAVDDLLGMVAPPQFA